MVRFPYMWLLVHRYGDYLDLEACVSAKFMLCMISKSAMSRCGDFGLLQRKSIRGFSNRHIFEIMIKNILFNTFVIAFPSVDLRGIYTHIPCISFLYCQKPFIVLRWDIICDNLCWDLIICFSRSLHMAKSFSRW